MWGHHFNIKFSILCADLTINKCVAFVEHSINTENCIWMSPASLILPNSLQFRADLVVSMVRKSRYARPETKQLDIPDMLEIALPPQENLNPKQGISID